MLRRNKQKEGMNSGSGVQPPTRGGVLRAIRIICITFLAGIVLIMLCIGGLILADHISRKIDDYGWFKPQEEKHFLQALKDFRVSGKETIALKELTNFDWDRVCYMGPYTTYPLNEIRRSTSKEYTFATPIPDLDDDGGIGLIFLSDKDNTGRAFVIKRGKSISIESKTTGCFLDKVAHLNIRKSNLALIVQ